MTKVKLFLFLSFLFLGVLNSLIAQTDYQLSFYKCDGNDLGAVDYRLHSPDLTVSDYVSYQKIECKEPSSGIYHFTTNKAVLRVGIRNIYNQKLDTILELQKGKTEYKLCSDKFIDYELKTSLEKSFENRKKWTLQYSSNGVYATKKANSQDESITITYTKRKIHATYRVNKRRKKKITLDTEHQNSLILFEKKLKLMDRTNTSCPVYSNYYISSFAENFQIKNNTCLWDGFNELKSALGF